MIFEITTEHIAALSDSDLRTLVGLLAERELVNQGHSTSAATYGGNQNAADGGIDVRVQLDAEGGVTGYIPRTPTGYQVKAEDMPRAKILGEMRDKEGELKASIRDLGEAGGAYVIVSSKGSLSDTALSARKNAMSEALVGSPTAQGLHVDFYDRQRIASWVNNHPGLIPWVREHVAQPLTGWQAFKDWSSSPGAPSEEYLQDDGVRLVGVRLKDSQSMKVAEGISHLRTLLNQPSGSIRLVGLSGVGKTRLVQALFDDRVGADAIDPQLAIYTDLSDQPDPVPLELLGRLNSLQQRCVLIVDNCGLDLHRKLTSRMKEARSPISLITIEYDVSDDEPEKTDVFKLEPASSEVIQKILARRYNNLSSPEIRTIAEFSEGNSRVAIALAETATEGESLANLNDSELFKRLFRQKQEENPALLKAAKVCSLVYSFDAETLEGDDAELPLLAELAEQSTTEFHGHVAELMRRQLVQRRSKWRAFLPHALAHRLAKQALQDIPISTVTSVITHAKSQRLIKSFSRRLGCLHDVPEAQAMASDWLKKGGWLSDIDNLNDLGMTVFRNIAPIDPEATLDAIQTAADNSTTFTTKENRNRDGFVRLLRSLAYDPERFERSVSLISRFAKELKTSNNTSEAINVFTSLFHLLLSGTHATAEQRCSLIRRLYASTEAGDQELAIVALKAMLKSSQFSSHQTFEFGTRRRDYGYRPKTGDDFTHWFAQVFALCREIAETSQSDAEIIKSILANKFRMLVPHTGMVDELITLVRFLAEKDGWTAGWAAVRGARRAAAKAKRAEDVEKLDALAADLEPKSIAEMITAYVLPEQWSSLDLADVEVDDAQRFRNAAAKVGDVCRSIGVEIAEQELFVEHLPSLLGAQRGRVSIVAYEVGKNAADPDAIWNIIVDSTETASDGGTSDILTAFLAGLCEVNRSKAEEMLDAAMSIEALHPDLVRMQCALNIDEKSVTRLDRMLEMETVPTWTFSNLSLGRALDDLPPPSFKALISKLSMRDEGLSVALDILKMHLFSLRSSQTPVPDEVKDVGRQILAGFEFNRERNTDRHDLASVALGCLTSPQDEPIAREVCNNLRTKINSWEANAWEYSELVSNLAEEFPETVLDVLVEQNGREGHDVRDMFGMFRENRSCPINVIDPDRLLIWANENPETRFIQIAEVIDPWHKPDEETPISWTPAALRLMREAPDSLAVLDMFVAGFHPSGWSGSLAENMAAKIPLLEELAAANDEAISQHAEKSLTLFREQIERERQREEKYDRERDERFEW